jgi:hypothetical protein
MARTAIGLSRRGKLALAKSRRSQIGVMSAQFMLSSHQAQQLFHMRRGARREELARNEGRANTAAT